MHDAALSRALGPEIHAIHVTMREPHRFVMHVVMGLARHVGLHRIVAGHTNVVRADHRIQNWLGVSAEDLFGEEVSVDFHAKLIIDAPDRNLAGWSGAALALPGARRLEIQTRNYEIRQPGLYR